MTVSDDLPETVTNYSLDATTGGTYREMTVSSQFKTTQSKMQVPIAGSVRAADSSTPPYTTGGGTAAFAAADPSGDGEEDDSPTCEVLVLAKPMTTLTVSFEAERMGTPPIIPTPDVDDSNLVLLDEELSPLAVGLGPDGVTPMYRIGGVYSFAMLKARRPGSALALGVLPLTSFAYADTLAQLGPETFTRGIIDAGGNPDSSTG